jgi:NAD(P)H-flavin reductase
MRTLTEDMADPAKAGPASWITPEPWRVAGVTRESADTVTLELEPPEPFVFEPGQFNMLSAAGIGEVPISISSDPGDQGRILHTIRDVGAVTSALCAAQPGQQVGVRGPYGSHWPLRAAEGGDLVIVAGGIGLPPLRPAIYQALGHRDRYQRVVLLYGARTPGDLLFTSELAAWRSRFDLTVEVTVDAGHRDWRGNVGVVPDLIGKVSFDPAKTTAFMVGPEIMMRFAVLALRTKRVPEDRVFLSMERNMQCAAALCGHCQFGPFLICRDGPVLSYRQLAPWITLREI